MANRLKMAEHQAIIGLVRLRWSYRRIAAELGIDRQTVSRACYALSPQFISRASMRNANAARCMPASVDANRS
jgi:hypothetical protein